MPCDDIEVEITKTKKDRSKRTRTSFARELMKDEAELRYMKEKSDEDFNQKVDDMIEEIGKLDVISTHLDDADRKVPNAEEKDDEHYLNEEDTVDVCSKCGEEIVGSSLVVGDDNYHEECFTCDHCGDRYSNSRFSLKLLQSLQFDREVLSGWRKEVL